ncbi:MAG: ATP-binding cassette domain-containing protein [Candidatus Bathyarchaeia archaeon]
METFDLTKRFGDLVAVDHIDLKIREGEIFGLLGPNGAGKTTTIMMLCTIFKPTEGTAKVSGYDIVKQPDMIRRSIGIVFQDTTLDLNLTGRENLELHGMLYGMPREQREARMGELLDFVGLSDRANDLVETYSGGMMRRLETARGLLPRPKLLFLDEPTLGLDPQTRFNMWTHIKELNKREGVTILITTHYMDEAERLCDRVAIIDFGRILAVDTPDNLKRGLGEDVVLLKTADHFDSQFVEEVTRIKSIKKAKILRDNELSLSAVNGEELIPKLFDVARSSGIHVKSVDLHRPTLDDVFLHLTGRGIRPEEGADILKMRVRSWRRARR